MRILTLTLLFIFISSSLAIYGMNPELPLDEYDEPTVRRPMRSLSLDGPFGRKGSGRRLFPYYAGIGKGRK